MMKSTLAALLFLGATAAAAHEAHADAPRAKKPAAPASTPSSRGAPAADAAPSPGHAPGDHEHLSPHGGLVATVDRDVHVEVLFTDSDVQVWFYDAEMKPVPLPNDAKATLVVGKAVKKLALPVAKGTDGATADYLGAPLATVKDQKLSIVIQATVAGKARSARVERAAALSTAPTTAPTTAPK